MIVERIRQRPRRVIKNNVVTFTMKDFDILDVTACCEEEKDEVFQFCCSTKKGGPVGPPV